MAKNKIVYNGNTLIDLTGDTVTADKLMQGYTAHDRSGVQITGTATSGGGGASLGTKTITANGTYDAEDDGYDGYSSVNVNVSGGGGGCTLLGSVEFAVSTTSTSVSSVGTYTISGLADVIKNKIIYFNIYDKAGIRNGYFFGYSGFQFPNPNGTKTNFPQCFNVMYSTNGTSVTFYKTNNYGVYVQTVGNGVVTVAKRYNSNYSKTINGTFHMDVYAIDPPNWPGIFVAT